MLRKLKEEYKMNIKKLSIFQLEGLPSNISIWVNCLHVRYISKIFFLNNDYNSNWGSANTYLELLILNYISAVI